MLWRIVDHGQPWDGMEVEADDWQAARCEAEEAIRVDVVNTLQFQLVEVNDVQAD